MLRRVEAILLFALLAEIAVFLTLLLVCAGIGLSVGSMKRAIQGAIILATVGLTATRKPLHA